MFENMIKNEVNILKEENKEQLYGLEKNELIGEYTHVLTGKMASIKLHFFVYS